QRRSCAGPDPELARGSQGPGGQGAAAARPLSPSTSALARVHAFLPLMASQPGGAAPSRSVPCPGRPGAAVGAEPPSLSQLTSMTRYRARSRRRAIVVSAWEAGASPTRARTGRSTCTATPWVMVVPNTPSPLRRSKPCTLITRSPGPMMATEACPRGQLYPLARTRAWSKCPSLPHPQELKMLSPVLLPRC
ncbi:unnamed protein product, partial [Gulo gulo]